MKYRIALATSLLLNVVWVGTFFFAPARQSATGDLHPREPITSPRQPRIISEPEQIPEAARLSRGPNQPAWQRALPQLRDAGVPPDVLAALVVSDFELRWQKELRDFEKRYQAGAVSDDDRARFEARRDEEQEEALRAALGDEGFRQWDRAYSLRDLDLVELQLSSTETDALYRLRKDRALKDRLLTEAWRDGTIDQADHDEQQSAAQQEYDRQFKLLVGEERYAALQEVEEGMAGALRQKARGLNPVDSQLEAMAEAERKWNQQRAELEGQLRALDAARDQEYQQVLGTNDFDQLQKNQDRRYRLLKRHANSWSLSDSDIDYVYSLLHQDGSSTDEIEQSLRSYLGSERFGRLRKNDLFDRCQQTGVSTVDSRW